MEKLSKSITTKTWSIPRVPIAHNKALREHWRERQRDSNSWRVWVWAVLRGRIHPPAGRVQCRIDVARRRIQDKDNAYASVKPLVDALRVYRWIRDDSPRWLDLEVSERASGAEEATTVTLTGAF